MIGEFLRYWTTLAPERARKYGYLKRLIALEFRERRCRGAWGPHLARTRQYIVKAIDLVPRPRSVVIVGSGLLLDVPLEDLADRFERVYLVDIFHMPQVRRAVRRYFNVKLLTGDVTGIFAMFKENKAPGPRTPPPPPRIPHLADADMIVSCNCLTQLAGPFNDLFRATRGFADADCDLLSAQVMEAHVAAIAQQAAGVGVLITDTERFAMQGDKIVSRTDLLKTVRLPPPPRPQFDEEWDWLIAPAPEEHPSQDMLHVVSARIYERQVPEEKVEAQVVDTGEPVADLPAEDGLADEITPPVR
ncbi:MAG: hypothetical protein EPO08_13300 [Rhodospirillaceae bacterium]|nr:MAG: hypothetical protein EPO08_13300 [Rhodospirillaceae bacterium]